MRIECTQGCGATLTVDIPPAPARDASEADFTAWRDQHAEIVGRAVMGTLIAHLLYDCPLAAADGDYCGHISPMGHQCNSDPNHKDNHQLELEDESGNTRIVATWPRLEIVP